MPKPRNKENKGLPSRWQWKHGAYYFRVPAGLEPLWEGKTIFKLGVSLPAAYKTWASRLEFVGRVDKVAQLLDRYRLEVVPTKALTTQEGNIIAISRLSKILGELRVADIKPQLIYQYFEKRQHKVAARRELEVLSHAFTKAVEWGYVERHPFKGEVRLPGEKPRTRYIEDWEILEILNLRSARKRGSVRALQAYIKIKLLTGLRRGDLLRLQPASFSEDGIPVSTRKTGKRVIYSWSPELKAAIGEASAVRPVDLSPWLFCNAQGKCYIDETTGRADGWASMWQRFVARVIAETKVTALFTEHDLRAKCASDATTLEHARALLAHADSRTTDRIYRRKPERVRPLR